VEPLIVEQHRNGTLEARHRVHAVAVRKGTVIGEAGDIGFTCFMRSSSKPIQALSLVRARDDLTDREIAIACASHEGTRDQIAAVSELLSRAEATQDDLELGLQECRPPEKIFHNCSGKHAGMLALCRARAWPIRGYHLPDHDVQQQAHAAHAEATSMADDRIQTATDGCGVLTFALPLERMAYAYGQLEQLPQAHRVTTAMRAHPDLVGGPNDVDVRLMRAMDGWIAKAGADGILCAASVDGTGVALKAEDGASRPLGPALAGFLESLGIELPHFAVAPVTNSRGDHVGDLRIALVTRHSRRGTGLP